MTERERFERYQAAKIGVNNHQKFEAWFEQEYKVKLSRKVLDSGKYDALLVATRKAWQAATAQAVPEGYVVVKPALDSAAKCKMICDYTFNVNDTDTLIPVPWSMIKQIYKGGIECMIQAAKEGE